MTLDEVLDLIAVSQANIDQEVTLLHHFSILSTIAEEQWIQAEETLYKRQSTLDDIKKLIAERYPKRRVCKRIVVKDKIPMFNHPDRRYS